MLIVCSQTGTVLEAEHCMFFDPNELPPEARDEWEESDGNDSEVSRIAKQYGQNVSQVLDITPDDADPYKKLANATRKELAERSLRSGDLTWSNAIPYSPSALREVFANMLEEGDLDNTTDVDAHSRETYKAVYYGANFADDAWLTLVAELALNGSLAWLNYKPSIIDAVKEAYITTNEQEKA